MTTLYAIFDQSNCGLQLAISNSGTTLTFTVDGADVHRLCRSLYPQSTGQSYAEFLFYAASGATPTIAGNAALGIVTASASLALAVGEDTNGYGWYPDGTIKKNNSTLQTITGYGLNDTPALMLSCQDPLNPSLTFLLNGVIVGTQALASTGPWYLAASIGGTPAGSMLVQMNAGQQAFQYPQGNVQGWVFNTPSINQILLSTYGYTSLPTDGSPNQIYAPALNLDNRASLTITRILQFWPWRSGASAGNGGQSWGSIVLDDPNGEYDSLLQNDVRDLPIKVLRTQQGASRDSAQVLATGVIDHVEANGDFRKTVYIKDGLALLDKNVQRSLELPNVATSAVGLPQPISIGACRNVAGLLISTDGQTFQFHDSALLQVVEPRVAGKLLSLVTNDYALTPDGRSVRTAVAPVGKFTASVSGLNAIVPPAAPDLLGGAGEFQSFTLSSQFTANWLQYYNTGVPTTTPPAPQFITTAGYGQIEFFENHEEGIPATIATRTNVIKAGKSYAVKFYVDEMPKQDLHFANQPTLAYCYISGVNYFTPLIGWSPMYYSSAQSPAGGSNIIAPMEVVAIFTNTQNIDLPLNLTFLQNDQAGTIFVNFKVKYIRLYQMPDALSVPSLTGCNLSTYMQNIIENVQHLGLQSAQWNIADAQAIDAATLYNSGGYHLDQPTSGRNALQPMLDSWRSDLYLDRSGVIRTARLIDPASVTPLGIIDETVIVGSPASGPNITGAGQEAMINVVQDLAPGLTTLYDARKNWTVYTDGDFGQTSLTDCPNTIRALLKKPFQQRASSAAQLSPMYLYAQQASAFPSCFDLVSEAQTECDSTAALYTVPRYFYAVPVKSDASDIYDLGQVWTLTYPRYGLNAGKPVYIFGIVEVPNSELVTLLCWG